MTAHVQVFMALINVGNYKEKEDPRTLNRLRWSSLGACHEKVTVILKYTFTDVSGLLELLL